MRVCTADINSLASVVTMLKDWSQVVIGSPPRVPEAGQRERGGILHHDTRRAASSSRPASSTRRSRRRGTRQRRFLKGDRQVGLVWIVSARALIVEMPFTSESCFVKYGTRAPAHQDHLTAHAFSILADDRLERAGGDVVSPNPGW